MDLKNRYLSRLADLAVELAAEIDQSKAGSIDLIQQGHYDEAQRTLEHLRDADGLLSGIRSLCEDSPKEEFETLGLAPSTPDSPFRGDEDMSEADLTPVSSPPVLEAAPEPHGAETPDNQFDVQELSVHDEPQELSEAEQEAERQLRVLIGHLREAIFAASQEMRSNPRKLEGSDLTDWKRLVCGIRAFQQMDDEPFELFEEEFRYYNRIFNESTGGAPFFAFSRSRSHSPEVWLELSQAYFSLREAQLGLLMIEGTVFSGNDRSRLIEACAHLTLFMDWVIDQRGLDVWDDVQREVKRTIHELTKCWEVRVPLMQVKNLQKATALEIATKLSESHARIEEAKATVKRQSQVRNALEGLDVFIRQAPNESESFIEELAAQIESLLDLKVRPTDKTLVRHILPFLGPLRDLNRPKLARTLDAVAKEHNVIHHTGQEFADYDHVTNQEADLRAEDLKKLLSGKTVLFVGGNKGQKDRKEDIRKRLDLKELLWPDSEDKTNPSFFAADVARADLVCMLIRWSRHSYKSVIDSAKQQGKMTAILPRGLGPNTVIHDLHDQLIGKKP